MVPDPDAGRGPEPSARRLDRLRRPIVPRPAPGGGSGRARPSRPPSIAGGPTDTFARPTSVFVSSPSPRLVPWVVYAIAHAGTRRFHWVDLGDAAPSVPSPIDLGWVPADCRWAIADADLRATVPEPTPRAVHSLLQRDDGNSAARLLGFLQLPDVAQRILAEPPPVGRSGVIVVPHAERADGAFPWLAAGPLIDLLAGSDYSLVVGRSGPAPPARAAFATVLRVEEDPSGAWPDARLICERGTFPLPTRTAPSVRLSGVPHLAAVLRRANLRA